MPPDHEFIGYDIALAVRSLGGYRLLVLAR
jgi:hypothetical protein